MKIVAVMSIFSRLKTLIFNLKVTMFITRCLLAMHIKAWLVGTRLPTVTYRLIVLNNQWHAARISSLTFFILLRATLIIIFMSWWVFKFQIYYFLTLTKTEELISILTISVLIFTDKNTVIILLIIISTCWYLTNTM